MIGDDDRAVRMALREFLQSLDYEVVETISCKATKEAFQNSPPDAAILDYRFPDGTAMEMLPALQTNHPTIPIILLTGNGTIPLAVQAIQSGAHQFLTKPVDLSTIEKLLETVLQRRHNQLRQKGDKPETRRIVEPFLGISTAIRRLQDQASRAATSHLPVLITGETGSGKGVLARWLHDCGPRSHEVFVDLNCASFGRDLLETELFGHEAGAFTGATQRKLGLLEVAHRGSIFLDEIGDMDPTIQPKLLKALEEQKFRRLGDIVERQLDIRLISATHQDLSVRTAQKQFRSDLFFRVSALVLSVPPLRERSEDIPLLARYFFDRATSEIGRKEISMPDETIKSLATHAWPGNIRELKNAIDRAVVMTEKDFIAYEDLQIASYRPQLAESGAEGTVTLREAQRRHIARALTAERGNVVRAASRLGITRSSLYNKMNTYGLKRDPDDGN